MNKVLLFACLALTFIASCADSLLVVALFGVPGMVCGIALILRLRSAQILADPRTAQNCAVKRKTALTAATVGAAQEKKITLV